MAPSVGGEPWQRGSFCWSVSVHDMTSSVGEQRWKSAAFCWRGDVAELHFMVVGSRCNVAPSGGGKLWQRYAFWWWGDVATLRLLVVGSRGNVAPFVGGEQWQRGEKNGTSTFFMAPKKEATTIDYFCCLPHNSVLVFSAVSPDTQL